MYWFIFYLFFFYLLDKSNRKSLEFTVKSIITYIVGILFCNKILVFLFEIIKIITPCYVFNLKNK